MFILHPVGGGDAVIPTAVPGQRVVLTVETVGLFAVVIFHQLVGIGVLRVPGIQVTLTAVTGFQFNRLHRREVPAHHTVNVLVDDAFTTGWQRVGIGAGTFRLMALVDVTRIGLRFIQVTKQAEAEIPAQRTIEGKVSAFGRAFLFVFRCVEIGIPGAVPLVAALFGDDIHHATGGAVTVTCGSRPAQDFNAFDHLRRHPGRIATGIALTAPTEAHGVTTGHWFTVDQDQGVFWAHPTNINLTVIAALAAGRVTGQVNARHGTNDFRDVASGRVFANFICGDSRHARSLQVLLGGGNHNSIFMRDGGAISGFFCHCGQRYPVNP